MKKIKNIKGNGFTLIELMVVIAIIAILAIVGITIFSGRQAQARDARRTGDIQSIAQSLENHFIAQTDTNTKCGSTSISAPGYCPIDATWFAGDVVPADPSGSTQPYCLYYGTSPAAAMPAPAVSGTRWSASGCPTAAAGYTGTSILTANPPISGGIPSNAWMVCAQRENKDGSGNYLVYCQSSSQQ